MDNIEKIIKNNKDLEILNSIGEGLTKLYGASKKDPLFMTDAEFNNLCNLVTINKAQLRLMKESVAAMEDFLNNADAALQLAKFIRRNRE